MQTSDLTPEKIESMREFGQHAATLFQRHSAGAGGMVRALGEDVVALANAYERAAAERNELILIVGHATALTNAALTTLRREKLMGEEEPDAAG